MENHQLKQTVLIVDDGPENIRVLDVILRPHYEVKAALDGEKALAIARSADPPDIVLLDIAMPVMDGYEVCRVLKEDAGTAEIPVIFVTAKSGVEDERKGFDVGAVDYITKPLAPALVLARVKTHLKLQTQNIQLLDDYKQLRELEDVRDSLVHMIIHDLRSPLMAVLGYLEMLESYEKDNLSDRGKKYVKSARVSTETLNMMISSVLDVSRMESGSLTLALTEFDLAQVARQVLARLESLKGNREMVLDLPERPVLLVADQGLVSRVIENLLGNSFKFTPADGRISVTVNSNVKHVSFAVENAGEGIPAEYHKKIFEKFGQVESNQRGRKYSTGLGLAFCKLAVEAHGGKIGVNSEPGRGSAFWFELPASPPVNCVPETVD
jgi:signal transduction histidine kinase